MKYHSVMEITTGRLALRPWRKNSKPEAESLYRYASDPQIGPLCGWMPHRNVADSANTLKNVFTGTENYAITLKDNPDGADLPIGAIELKPTGPDDHATQDVRLALESGGLNDDASEDEVRQLLARAESDKVLGYWIGSPFWGQGLMTEALDAMLRHAFEDLDANAVWGGHYAENIGSGKVMEHCGLKPICMFKNDYFPLIDEHHDCVMRVISREEWERIKA